MFFCICNILDDAAEIHLATIFPYCTEEMTGQSPLVRTGHALNELLIVMRSLYSTTNSKGSLDCCLAHDCIVEKSRIQATQTHANWKIFQRSFQKLKMHLILQNESTSK